MPLGLQWCSKTEKSGASEIAELRAYRTPLSHRGLMTCVGATFRLQARHQWILATYSAQRQTTKICLPGLLADTCLAQHTPPLPCLLGCRRVSCEGVVSCQPHKNHKCDSGNSLGCFRWQHRAVPPSFPLMTRPCPQVALFQVSAR